MTESDHRVHDGGELPSIQFTVKAPRECRRCGWTLPEQIPFYFGPCPRCDRVANGHTVDH
jgi:hypothetical protein